MIFGKIFFKILIIKWDIWEVWDENLGEALTHLLGNCRQSRRGTSWKKMVGIMGVVGAMGGGESGGRAPEPPKGDKPEKDGGSCGSSGSCGSTGYSWKGSGKTQLFSLNSFSHFAIISASGIVFKKPLANKKLKLS